MTWTKLGDEHSEEARDLTDAEYRTDIEALGWSNRRLLDLRIPKRDLRRFAESPDADLAVEGLIAKGRWAEDGECWFIGLVHPEWQLERVVVLKRREAAALRQRRSRLHRVGDHTLCIPEHCPYVTRNTPSDQTSDPVRDGSDRGYAPPDPSLKTSSVPISSRWRRLGEVWLATITTSGPQMRARAQPQTVTRARERKG